MFRTFTFAAVLIALTPAALLAATSKANNKFTVPMNYDKAVEFYESHRAEVLRASNCHMLADLGNGEYKLQTNTPLGGCVYVLKEVREQGKDKQGRRTTIYRFKYVRGISGRVSYQEVTIAVTELSEKKCEVGMWMTTTVAGRFVPVFAVSSVQQSSLAGTEAYFAKHAR
jgi:hypothetical protein